MILLVLLCLLPIEAEREEPLDPESARLLPFLLFRAEFDDFRLLELDLDLE